MSAPAPATYELRQETRTLAAVLGEQERHRFMVGSMLLREENEIHVVEYEETTRSVNCVQVLNHPSEVWGIACCPVNPRILCTTFNTGTTYSAALWRTPALETGGAGEEKPAVGSTRSKPAPVDMEELARLPAVSHERVQRVVWHPAPEAELPSEDTGVEGNRLAAAYTSSLHTFVVGDGALKEEACIRPSEDEGALIALAWDPHHAVQCTSTQGGHVVGFDLRTKCEIRRMRDAHRDCVRDVDYNPNRPWYLVSGGDDGAIRFWDLRRCDAPVKEMHAHSHWLWSVRYNRCHDQLLVTSSSDCTAKLWRASSVSSTKLFRADEDDAERKDGDGEDEAREELPDAVLQTCGMHSEAVYAATWSAAEPWIFATASYDGTVAVHQVAEEEKDHILMDDKVQF
mmetsp:Transcript_15235/g.48618  ORF Transcript_15235/g.48618 Transcript_15235/m.48618 type:complete len:400 (+) Transcript_15235:21-1220(+)